MSDSVDDRLDALARRAAADLRRALPDAAPPAPLLDRLRTAGTAAERGASRPARRLALAAALAATFVAGVGIGMWVAREGAGSPRAAATAAADRPQLVRFVFAAPRARRVSLVGEFNGWNAEATPMHRSADGVLWAASLALPPGRHLYAFVVDDSTWLPDPDAPLAPDSWFGVRNSVMVVSDGTGL